MMRNFLTAILLLSMSTAHAGSYVYQQGQGVSFGWLSADKFSVFTSSGTLMPHTVKNIESDEHYATTECVGWALVAQNSYYGCYPYLVAHKLAHYPYTALPVAYTSQAQSANDNTEHLASVDYMTAQGTATVDALSLLYSHLGCMVRFAAYVPETKTFSSLALTTKDNTAWFAEEATINAADNTISATQLAATATLALNSITVEGGDSLIAYMMVAPTDLSNRSMLLSISATDGSALQTYLEGCNMQAGKVCQISVGKENYFRIQPDNGGTGGGSQEILSLLLDIEQPSVTDTQITTATAYAADFAFDTENTMKPFLLGDANLDGTVDVTDVVKVVNHYQAETTDELDLNICDIDGDGVIDVTDVVGIVNIYHSK